MDILNFKRILAKNPKSLLFARLADSMRAMSLGTETKLDEALLIANKGLEANPNFLQGRLARGRILLEKGDLLGAKIDFEAVAKIDQFCFSAQKLLLETSEKLEQPLQTEVYEKILDFFEQENPDGTANKTGEQPKKVESKLAKPAVSASKSAPESASLSAALDNILNDDDGDEESEISNLLFKAVNSVIGLELPALGSKSLLETSKDNKIASKSNIDSVIAEALSGSDSEAEPELIPYEPKKKTKVMPAVTAPPVAPTPPPVAPAASAPPVAPTPPPVAPVAPATPATPPAAKVPPVDIAPLVAPAPQATTVLPAVNIPPVDIAPLVAPTPQATTVLPAVNIPSVDIAPLVASAPQATTVLPAVNIPPVDIAPLVASAPPQATTVLPAVNIPPVDIPPLDIAPLVANAPPAKTASPAAPNLEDILKEQLSDKVENLPDLTLDINSVLAEAAASQASEPPTETAPPVATAPPASTAPLAATAHPVAAISPIAPNLEDILKEQLSDKVENLPDLTTDINSVLAEAASISNHEPEPELKPYIPSSAKKASTPPAAPNIDDILKEQLSDKVENLPDLTVDINSVLEEAAKFSAPEFESQPEPELKPYEPKKKSGKAGASSAAPNLEDILKEQLSDKVENVPDFTADMDSLLKEHQDKTLAQNPTPTLAELYMDQGLPEKAAEVYRELLARNPDNKELKTKLALVESHK